jgi:hypothetical protein
VDNDCASELRHQLFTLLMTKIIINNTMELGMPLVTQWLNERATLESDSSR